MTFLICISCKSFVRTELEGWCCLLPYRFAASLKYQHHNARLNIMLILKSVCIFNLLHKHLAVCSYSIYILLGCNSQGNHDKEILYY